MHVTTKEVDQSGTHILTSVVEGDGPNPICSADAKLEAKVISLSRTDSGGIQVQTAVTISEPAPAVAVVAAVPLTADQQATAYLVSKGQSETDAAANVAKFGADRILTAKADDEAAAAQALDAELKSLLSSTPAPKETVN